MAQITTRSVNTDLLVSLPRTVASNCQTDCLKVFFATKDFIVDGPFVVLELFHFFEWTK